MDDYSKITALYSRLSVGGDGDRDGGESNNIQNQKKFLKSYAGQLKITNIRHYIDDDESGRFTNQFDEMTPDYTRKGGVVHTEFLLPYYASAEYADRAVLWNEVEKIEKAKNAQLAREIEIAAVKGAYLQTAKLVERRSREHRAAHPCRLH